MKPETELFEYLHSSERCKFCNSEIKYYGNACFTIKCESCGILNKVGVCDG